MSCCFTSYRQGKWRYAHTSIIPTCTYIFLLSSTIEKYIYDTESQLVVPSLSTDILYVTCNLPDVCIHYLILCRSFIHPHITKNTQQHPQNINHEQPTPIPTATTATCPRWNPPTNNPYGTGSPSRSTQRLIRIRRTQLQQRGSRSSRRWQG